MTASADDVSSAIPQIQSRDVPMGGTLAPGELLATTAGAKDPVGRMVYFLTS